MALSSILQKIQQKGIIKHQPPPKPSHDLASLALSIGPSNGGAERPIDPVVARLKAARKAEREMQEKLMREKKGLGPKKNTTSSTAKKSTVPSRDSSTRSISRSNIKQKGLRTGPSGPQNNKHLPPRQEPKPKMPKMSFAELMQKASSIDQSKLSILLEVGKSNDSNLVKSAGGSGSSSTSQKKLPADNSPSLGKISHSTQSSSKKNIHGTSHQSSSEPSKTKIYGSSQRSIHDSRSSNDRQKSSNGVMAQKKNGTGTMGTHAEPQVIQRAPLPIRKPSSQLQAKLKQIGRIKSSDHGYKQVLRDKDGKQRHEYNNDDDEDEEEYDDDLDSFIASDEEIEELGPDYDRDEIWSMFNRGRKRTYYNHDDYDSDDMEATGAEILAEEARSKISAMEEDRREQAEEERLAAIKRARKMRNR